MLGVEDTVGGLPRAAAVRCSSVTVDFGSVLAVDDVDLTLPVGGIHALVGQNGAGKTTLARAIAGLQPHTSGTVQVNGVEVPPGANLVARRSGVDMVHQHPSLIPELSVAEALELGSPSPRRGPFLRAAIERRWSEFLESRGVDVDVRRRVKELSVELVQSVEIARANPGKGGLLLLDEPTAVLAPSRIEALFEQLRAMAVTEVTILIVLHKLSEVRNIADTVTVLREGRLVLGPTPVASTTDAEVGAHIVGEDLADSSPRSRRRVVSSDDERAIAASDIDAEAVAGDSPLHDLSLDVARGEIVGVAGVEGNGQRTLVETLVGLRLPMSGAIRFLGVDCTTKSVEDRRAIGIRSVPFDRNAEGTAAELPLWQNLLGWEAQRFRRWDRLPFLSAAAMRRRATERLQHFQVAYADIDQPVASLSGGNTQRLILARELPDARALVVAQPTRGLDISGIAGVWQALVELAASGVPILVVSSDLDELLEHSDRLAVIRGGTIVASHPRPFHRSAIGYDMVGAVGP